MNAFEFFSVGRIVFGCGQIGRIGELAAGLGRAALVVTNAGESEQGATSRRLAELMQASGVRTVFLWQAGEPAAADVDRALQRARGEKCDMVVGLGGGSAIDAAKAVAGLMTNGGSAIDYMEVVGGGRKITRPAAPWIAVPTTAGTGAEVTRNAVIAAPEKHYKASIRSEHLLARAVVVDPELGVGVPPEVTARTGMDALCQLIESYTSTGAGPITDALAMEGLARATRSLRRAFADGRDLAAREDMALAALLSGIALTNAGLGAVHGLAAPLGARVPVPHGAACAALLPHVMSANVQALRSRANGQAALARYAAIGRVLTARADLDDEHAVDEGIQFAGNLARVLGIPPLGRFGLTHREIPGIVSQALRSSSIKYNPVPLPARVLEEILGCVL